MTPDKRLKFRRVEPKFNSRDAAIQYVSELTVNPELFGEGLYGEPIVAKYTENGKDLLLLAVGVENGKSYHIIDTYGLELDIARIERDIANLNSGSTASYSELIERIIAEEERAQAAENELSTAVNSINTEVEALSDSLEDFKNEVPETYATKTYVDEGLALIEGELNQLESEIPETYATKEFVTNEVSAINSAITKVATSLTELEEEIPNVYATKEQMDSAVTIINSAITTLDTTITELEQEIPETYATKTYVDNGLDTINSALTQHIADCAHDVTYNNGFIKLENYNHEPIGHGFDLEQIINRSTINCIGDNSSTYLKIVPRVVENETYKNAIEAIVDDSESNNTLATTSYVKSGITRAINESREYTNDRETIILNHTDTQDHELYRAILANTEEINKLKGPITVDGSVKDTIHEALIAAKVTTLSPDDIDTDISLIKWVETNNGPEYFVSNNAKDMVLVVDGSKYFLDTYIQNNIKSLQDRITYLEGVIGTITEPVGNLTKIIKNTVKDYLVGEEHEIEIKPIQQDETSVLQIKFPDNSIFGPYDKNNPYDE